MLRITEKIIAPASGKNTESPDDVVYAKYDKEIKNHVSGTSVIKKIDNRYFKSKGNIENMIFAYKIAKNLKINDKIIIEDLTNLKVFHIARKLFFPEKSYYVSMIRKRQVLKLVYNLYKIITNFIG